MSRRIHKLSHHLLQTVDDRVNNPSDTEIDDGRVPGHLPGHRSSQNHNRETNLPSTNEQSKVHWGQML